MLIHVKGYFTDVCVAGGGGELPHRCISASRLTRYKISTATSMFSGLNFSMVLSVTLPDETGSQKPKMAAEKM